MTNFEKYKTDLQEAKGAVNDAHKKLSALKSLCTHDESVQKSSYSSGGYDYKNSTTYWDECLVCGWCSERKEIVGNSFG
jgi:predicted translin family RNA/ssDNA-binding protein